MMRGVDSAPADATSSGGTCRQAGVPIDQRKMSDYRLIFLVLFFYFANPAALCITAIVLLARKQAGQLPNRHWKDL